MNRMARLAAAVGTLLALTVAFAAPASAHDTLTGSTPKKGATVESPSEIELTYSGSVRLPRVVVTDASGKEYQSGDPRAVDNKVTAGLNGVLPDGEYTVAWRVVSSDGHPIQGTYKFTVEGAPTAPAEPAEPSAAAEPPAPEPSPTNAAAADESRGSSGWLWLGAIALVIAAAAGAVAWLRRSSASKG